jgi:hypothetical protein
VRLAPLAAATALAVAGAALPAAATAAKPKPETGKTVVIARASGTVEVKPRGRNSFVEVTSARAIPVGSTVDATGGKVKLTSTGNASGSKIQSSLFYGGSFVVTQKKAKSPVTDLELEGGSFGDCGAALRSADLSAARRIKRKLWGNGRGRFRTRGRNGTATVRGTKWLTEDSCVGTAAETARGKVEAAPNDGATYDVKTGERITFHCEDTGIAPVSTLYCLVLGEDPAQNLFSFGIASSGTPDPTYDMCFMQPNGVERCDTLPFDTSIPNEPSGGYACFPDQKGTYVVRWRIRGVFLPDPLSFVAPRADEPLCVSSPPRPGIDDQFRGSALARAAAGHL